MQHEIYADIDGIIENINVDENVLKFQVETYY